MSAVAAVLAGIDLQWPVNRQEVARLRNHRQQSPQPLILSLLARVALRTLATSAVCLAVMEAHRLLLVFPRSAAAVVRETILLLGVQLPAEAVARPQEILTRPLPEQPRRVSAAVSASPAAGQRAAVEARGASAGREQARATLQLRATAARASRRLSQVLPLLAPVAVEEVTTVLRTVVGHQLLAVALVETALLALPEQSTPAAAAVAVEI